MFRVRPPVRGRAAAEERRSMAALPGRPLCRGYRALRRLRRGHAVDVYDAWSEERGCRCIAKVVRLDRAGDRETRASLFLEARLMLGLSHPHLVRAYELVRGRARCWRWRRSRERRSPR